VRWLFEPVQSPSVDEISQFERIETVLIAVFLQVLPVVS
jgi:hypothetical protein